MTLLDDLQVAGPTSPLLDRPGLVIPAYSSIPEYDYTLGDEAAGFAASIGMPPDPQQELALDVIFAVGANGKSAAYETGIVVARQNLKTATFEMAALSWIYLFDEPLVVWSAHEFGTVQETLRHMEGLVLNSDQLRPKTARINHAHGFETIETVWGSRIVFRTRTKTGGRGLSSNKVVLDEAFALHGPHMGALIPTMSAKPDPQLLYGSSACLEDSEILAELVERGRPGSETERLTDRPLHRVVSGPMALAYLEWCAPPPDVACARGRKCDHAKNQPGLGCAADRPVVWLRANPSTGIVRPDGGAITEDYIRAERQSLTVKEFIRERLTWHDKVEGGSSPVPPLKWAACADPHSVPRPGSPLAIGFAVSEDSASAAVALAGWRADGKAHGELIQFRSGTGWLVDYLIGVVERNSPCCLVMNPHGASGAFEKLLRALPKPNQFISVPKNDPDAPKVMPGQRILLATSAQEYAQGCGMLLTAVLEDDLRHLDQGPVNDAVRDGRKRKVAQAWAWDSPDGKEISPIEAVTLAQVGLATYGAKGGLVPFVLT